MIEYSFNKDENILYLKRIGDIFLDDILNIIDELNSQMENCRQIYILQDTSESSMKYNTDDLNPMILEFKQRIKNFDIVRIANYTEDPVETAVAFVFEELTLQIDKFHHKTFSTYENAKLWLKTKMIKDEDSLKE